MRFKNTQTRRRFLGIVGAKSAGLFLASREFDYTLFPRWPCLVKSGRDTYRLPEGAPRLPLMYSVRFRAPTA